MSINDDPKDLMLSQKQDEMDELMEQNIDKEVQQQEDFIEVLTKKERRKLSKALKDHPSKFRDKVVSPTSL